MTDSTASPTRCATRTSSSRVRLLPCPVSRTTCPSPQLLILSAGPLAHRPVVPDWPCLQTVRPAGNTRDAAVRFRQCPAACPPSPLLSLLAAACACPSWPGGTWRGLGAGLARPNRPAGSLSGARRRPRGGASGGRVGGCGEQTALTEGDCGVQWSAVGNAATQMGP